MLRKWRCDACFSGIKKKPCFSGQILSVKSENPNKRISLEEVFIDDFVINVTFADAGIAVNDIKAAEAFGEDVSDN